MRAVAGGQYVTQYAPLHHLRFCVCDQMLLPWEALPVGCSFIGLVPASAASVHHTRLLLITSHCHAACHISCCSVAAATKRSFEDVSNIRVQPFGSFVNGLSTWNSDVDLVVTGDGACCCWATAQQQTASAVVVALEKVAAMCRYVTWSSCAGSASCSAASSSRRKCSSCSTVSSDMHFTHGQLSVASACCHSITHSPGRTTGRYWMQ
jgi:hypothetical protein